MGKTKNNVKSSEKYKKEGRGKKVKKSVFASISIWWRFVCLLIVAILFIAVWDYKAYLAGFSDYLAKWNEGDGQGASNTTIEIIVTEKDDYFEENPIAIKIESFEDYISAIQNYKFPQKVSEEHRNNFESDRGYLYSNYSEESPLQLGTYILEKCHIEFFKGIKDANLKNNVETSVEGMIDAIINVVLVADIIILLIWIFTLAEKYSWSKENYYEFNNNILVITTAKSFGKKRAVRKVTVDFGGYVEVKSSTKGSFLGYGDVVLTLEGVPGEYVLKDVKHPYRVKQDLEELLEEEIWNKGKTAKITYKLM